jgi:hypothetical protein
VFDLPSIACDVDYMAVYKIDYNENHNFDHYHCFPKPKLKSILGLFKIAIEIFLTDILQFLRAIYQPRKQKPEVAFVA